MRGKASAYGSCPVCGAWKALLKDGRVGRHGGGDKGVWPPQLCKGWGEMPTQVREAT